MKLVSLDRDFNVPREKHNFFQCTFTVTVKKACEVPMEPAGPLLVSRPRDLKVVSNESPFNVPFESGVKIKVHLIEPEILDFNAQRDPFYP